MKMTQFRWSSSSGWEIKDRRAIEKANLVLLFADHPYFHTPACYTDLKQIFPQANLVGCSSAGNVLNTSISDNDIVAIAIIFEKGHVKLVAEDINVNSDIETIAAKMMNKLNDGNLRHVYILSDGLKINGSLLASGFHSVGGNKIPVTGGLAGDGTRFSSTWVMADAPARQGRIAAIGFYGDFSINTGCYSGWEEFGAERVVTRSEGNVVYEIDDQPALELYKKFLGKQADELPASGLRFPLSVRSSKESTPIIRTLLAVDELTQSLTFAGDVPKNYLCKLMKTNIDNLIDGAAMAAKGADPGKEVISSLCLVVSCVGRRLVLGQLTEEELEIVGERLGDNSSMIGFYSYGELAPFGEMLQCYLHNQTMTLTTIYE